MSSVQYAKDMFYTPIKNEDTMPMVFNQKLCWGERDAQGDALGNFGTFTPVIPGGAYWNGETPPYDDMADDRGDPTEPAKFPTSTPS